MEQRKEKFKREQLQTLWNNIIYINIYIYKCSQKTRYKEGSWKLFDEIMAENFLKWKKETDILMQEAQGLQTNETKETHDKAYHN